VTPLPYKQNLLESGDRYYVDEAYTLSGALPGSLAEGRWIMTSNGDRNASNSDYFTFNLPAASTLYVGYDANAASLPDWLAANYSDSGLLLNTTNPNAPVLRLYRRLNVSGNVTLGGANATVNGAAANYVAIIVQN
jgi:hypothetical protein